MHKVAEAGTARARAEMAAGGRGDGVAARVAVAGATGSTGQERLRLLARHPDVSNAAAMSSGQAGGESRRRLSADALTNRWRRRKTW